MPASHPRASTFAALFAGLLNAPLLSAPATAARAQAPAPPTPRDSLPARAGTYALEGAVGLNSTSFGALRFLSPRSAVGGTLSASYAHESGDATSSTNGGFTVNLGYRRYGRLRDAVAAFGTVGLTGGFSRYTQSQSHTFQQGAVTSDSRSNYTSVGAFGELGAAYLVVRRLAVNAAAQASVVRTFTRSSNEQTQTNPSGSSSNTSRQNGVGATLGPVRLGLTLFL